MNLYFTPLLFLLLCNAYLIIGVNLKRKKKCVSLFLSCNLNSAHRNNHQSRLFCYKKRVKAKELRKLSTEELEKEIIKCRLDIQKFQHQGFHDIHNYNVYYEKNARRKLAQLMTIYYERYLDKNVRIKSNSSEGADFTSVPPPRGDEEAKEPSSHEE
ncbi:50S ribosomal protein L29 [Plasmodium cynomolgi strain B]|uniref:50S ribosomal protein L29 n=1 Tax=Plasmodium cynomolgi (strain B) TaxID=1120755 RepID=K6UEG1_PLACD|nr:50S ribosomal protein L29 [Plasmodium cynomolgi strain B]GAB68291.1 50S ribosomal protein L29 [Plasmodium cynomolgi strain B]